jgi:parallel beta-helix repeat protein
MSKKTLIFLLALLLSCQHVNAAQQLISNGETLGETRAKINANDTELYDSRALTFDTLTALKANTVTGAGHVAVTRGRAAVGDGGGGTWHWSASDESTNVTNDPEAGAYAPPDSAPTGVGGAWVRVYSGSIDAKWFGLSTSSSNNSPAIKAAIDYAILNAPGKVILGSGTYPCTEVIGSFAGSNIEIDFQRARLDFSTASISSGTILAFTGTYGATATLTSNGVEKALSVAATSTSFSANDMVRIYSTAVWDSLRTSSRIGEINFVKSIPDAANITLTTELQSTYTTAASATIQKIIPVENIYIHNGTIIGPSANDGVIGIIITAGINCIVSEMAFSDIDAVHIRFIDCVFSKIENSHFQETNHASNGYGISFTDATQDCIASGNSFVDVRHSMTTNNLVSSSYGIARRIIFSNNVISDSAYATGGSGGDALDAHAGSDQISFIGNTINSSSSNGINFEGRSVTIANNLIMNTKSHGIHVQPFVDVGVGGVVITGNTLRNIGSSSAYTGIYVRASANDIHKAIVANNSVESFGPAIRLDSVDVGAGTKIFYGSSVTGNSAKCTGFTNGILLVNQQYATVSGNHGEGQARGIVVENGTNCTITGNTGNIYNSSGTTGYGIDVRGTGSYNVVSGNAVRYSSSGITTTSGITLGSSVTYTGVFGNVTQGFTSDVTLGSGTGNVEANNI